NTPLGKGPLSDNYIIRRQAIVRKIPCFTTISAAAAAVNAIEASMKQKGFLAEEETLSQRLKKSLELSIFMSVDYKNRNEKLVSLVRILNQIKPQILATKGTAVFFNTYGIKAKEVVPRISDGKGKSIIEYITRDKVAFILNVVDKKGERAASDAFIIRRAAINKSIPYFTTIEEALMELQQKRQLPLFPKRIKKLQEYHVPFHFPKSFYSN
ncbi:MAG: hypothetical protein J7M06_06130, partial [Proteobacteria bacterium]|nr:hypothetical protein [Pseudomonadota bacterium]